MPRPPPPPPSPPPSPPPPSPPPPSPPPPSPPPPPPPPFPPSPPSEPPVPPGSPPPPSPPPMYSYNYWKCYSTIGNSKVVTIYTKEVDYYTWGECNKDPGTGYYLCGDQCTSCMNNGLSDRGAGSTVVSDVRGHYNPASAAGTAKPWMFPQAGGPAFVGDGGGDFSRK